MRHRAAGAPLRNAGMITPILICLLIALSAYIGSSRQLSVFQFLIISSVFGIGAVLVLFPWLANRVAQLLNVGRGADLLLYFAVLSGAYVAAALYFRFKRLEEKLAVIVREMAIASPLSTQSTHLSSDGTR
jgi:hypothetical protein